MKIKIWKALLLSTLLFTLLGFPFQTAEAAISWNSSSLQSVYDPSGNIYTYAPSVVSSGMTDHIYTCHNKISGDVHDSIYYTKRVNGSVVESKEVLVSGPNGAWDDFHICDPSVIGGKFNYNGTLYNYAMFYLGNDHACSCNNQIGVAFSNDLSANTWVRYPNPIVTHPLDNTWGVGQPTATSVDGNGRVLLFYTGTESGDFGAWRRDINLNNMSAPSIGSPLKLTTSGLTGTDGNADYLNNYDIAYDGSRDRFFAIREMHPYPTSDPNFIGDSLEIVSIPGANVWSGGGSWQRVGYITPGQTGFARNHNGGLARDIWGGLTSSSSIRAVFTDSCSNCDSLWSYDLWQMTGTLSNGAGAPLAAGIESGSIYEVINQNSGLALHAASNGNVELQADNNSDAQAWRINDMGGGNYKLINISANKALDNAGAGTVKETNIQVWEDNGHNAQRWVFSGVGGGYYEVKNVHANLMMDAQGAGTTAGTNVWLWEDNNHPAQRWQFVKR
ncbi:RICIN domain-containing protein [Paenibacillus gansuensis]|uniref:RICIN domain-containing protein n=1 Tax=Paenibacillus gansuensis TaxID=306542 RepID=A0ABW5PFB8_9BACL